MGLFERPRVHFTPPSGWLNDPNGLVHCRGTYHLYYQHNPHDTCWGPMHWGHATSVDLVSWRHHQIALLPDERGAIYSGSAVVDEEGTAALGAGTFVVVFTHHRDGVEEQSLAWSHDGGETFTKHPMPVLEAPAGEPDFRDPRVLRYRAEEAHWVMLLAVGRAIWIYVSEDLTSWTRTGTVSGVFCGDGTWETPELMHFVLEEHDLWVLTVGIAQGAPAGGSGVQAVVGNFDGSTFTASGDAFWVDHGPAFYAPQAWSSAPDERCTWIGWMGNWQDPNLFESETWRGQMSVPREVSLVANARGHRLAQVPVPELASRRESSLVATGEEVGELAGRPLEMRAPAVDVIVAAHADGHGGAVIDVRCGRVGQEVVVRFDLERSEVAVTVDLGWENPTTYRAQLDAADAGSELRILLDVASVEVFADAATISVLLPNSGEAWALEIKPTSPTVQIDHIEVHSLASAG